MTNREAAKLGKQIAANLAASNPLVRVLAERFDLRLDYEQIKKDHEETANTRCRTRRN